MPTRDIDILRHLQSADLDSALEALAGFVPYLQCGALDWLRIKGVPSVFRPEQIRDFGLTQNHLPALMRCGAIVRVCRGLYRRADREPTKHYPLAVVSARSPGAIVCLHSALRVYGINSTERQPNVWVAIPQGSRAPRVPSLPLRIVHFSPVARNFRVTGAEFDGVPARITTPARTVADCFRFWRVAGANAGLEAFDHALDQRLVTIEELMGIERALPCRRLRALLRQ